MTSQEVRTVSSTGGAKGVKPERHDLIPTKGVAAISRVFAFGAQKYADHNWRKGYEWSKSFAALRRHLDAFWDGETFDEESGEPHLAHAGFHILVLLTWLEEQGEGVDNPMDDRWPYSMERARREEAAEEEARLLAEQAALDVEPISLREMCERLTSGSIPARFTAGIEGTNDNFGPDLLRKRRPRDPEIPTEDLRF